MEIVAGKQTSEQAVNRNVGDDLAATWPRGRVPRSTLGLRPTANWPHLLAAEPVTSAHPHIWREPPRTPANTQYMNTYIYCLLEIV